MILSYRNIYRILAVFVVSVCAVSCVPDSYELDTFEDGETDVEAEVVFSPITDALSHTRAPGDAIKRVESLCVLIYDKNKNFVKAEMVSQENINQEGNKDTASDAVGEGEHQAETTTPRAEFILREIDNGNYYIYAVANMGNVAEKVNGKPRYDVSTPEKLKEIMLKWDSGNVEKNNQMFGYFTMSDANRSAGFEAPMLTIKPGRNRIHAWVKRAASKVTVAIDGSGLNEGVEVYVKSIQIKDIPSICWLGKDNTPANTNLIADGEKFVMQDGEHTDKAGNSPMVSKSQPFFYPGMKQEAANLDGAHTETQQALFFYENMQGIGQSKKQTWTPGQTTPQFPNGNDPLDKGFKDNKRNGTYVEVIGYYKGSKDGKASDGPIIYRFMLGKDVDTNYDAQRNYHYKLTLKLLGNANDTDWHIVYDPEPDVIIPNPYYISYLYDQSMNLPLKIMGKRIISLRADIIENGWHAINATNETPSVYWSGVPNDEGVWNGFLSLRKTIHARFGTVAEGFEGKFAKTYTYNKTYWSDNKRGYREYQDLSVGTHNTEDAGEYTVSTNGAGEWTVSIPLYTRAAVMVEQTGYTGNNPYVAYRREAKVKITAKIEDFNGNEQEIICGTESSAKNKPVTIYQMRRVVNPKGIWRPGNSAKPFHVKMMVQEGENNPNFTHLKSDGPWLAVIKNGADWFDLVPTDGKSQKNPDGTISGVGDMYDENNNGREVDFTFKPKGTTSTPRGGLIKIYYNNYSCIHIIFVRQGYEPVSFYSSNVKWHSFNLKTASEEVVDPLLEGSYFRRYNSELPIDATNNKSTMYGWNEAAKAIVWNNNANHAFKIAGKSETKLWKNITTTSTSWPEFKINGKVCRLAKPMDVQEIINNENTIYGYGVLYTDESEYTVEDVAHAYGAREGDIANKGMRGVFVCDSVSGTQIFLPISATGYGRFKQKAMQERYNRQKKDYEGVNQYANRWAPMSNVTEIKDENDGTYGASYKPLLWDIYRKPGALYWICNDDNTRLSSYGLDVNYYSFNFYQATTGALGIADWGSWAGGNDPSGTDALLMRLVEE